MGLFQVVPQDFFSVLASPNREVYAEAIGLLNRMFAYDLLITVDDYVVSLVGLLENRVFIIEDDMAPAEKLAVGNSSSASGSRRIAATSSFSSGDETGSGLSGKARFILARLVETGWVDRETMDGSFVEIITPRSYAIPMMRLLSELEENQVQEYNSLVFSTYSALKQAADEHKDQMYEAVLTARANTEQLLYKLKTLYHGIRGHLRDIQEMTDVNELLADHFETYKQLADAIYHPIKTLDSIHRYRNPLTRILMGLYADSEMLERMRQRAVLVRNYASEDEAQREIVACIDFVLEVYGSIAGIIDQIDIKHAGYTRASIEKIQYSITADQSIRGKLVELLKAYGDSSAKDREHMGVMLEGSLTLHHQQSLDSASLYHRRHDTHTYLGEPLSVAARKDFSVAEVNQMLAGIRGRFSDQDVQAFLLRLLKGRERITEADFELAGDDDFILLLLTVIKAMERAASFTVHLEQRQAKKNGFLIPGMSIMMKEGVRSHVE
jgi:hypothetical protein